MAAIGIRDSGFEKEPHLPLAGRSEFAEQIPGGGAHKGERNWRTNGRDTSAATQHRRNGRCGGIYATSPLTDSDFAGSIRSAPTLSISYASKGGQSSSLTAAITLTANRPRTTPFAMTGSEDKVSQYCGSGMRKSCAIPQPSPTRSFTRLSKLNALDPHPEFAPQIPTSPQGGGNPEL